MNRLARLRFLLALSLTASLYAGVAVAQWPTPPKSTPLPHVYGTSVISYVEVPGIDFFPTDSNILYDSDTVARWSTNCGGTCLSAGLHLPSGAKVVYLELDFVDTDSNQYVGGTLVQCDFFGDNCSYHPAAGVGPSDCVFTGFVCSGVAFADGRGEHSADLTPDGITVDNFHNSYVLIAGGGSGSATKIAGMIVGYVLQVSPGPATATFTDVPTSHPFFKFVEALHAAGITNGYPDGRFGVNDPITRGQMAVYLSAALGLQWP